MQQEFLKDMIKPEAEMPFPVTLLAYSAPGKKQLAHVRSFNRDQPGTSLSISAFVGSVLAVSLIHRVSKVCNVKPRGAF